MVSTRHHPRPFPEPTLAPSRSPNGSTDTPGRETPSSVTESTSSKRRSTSSRRKSTSTTTSSSLNGPTTTPSKSSTSLTRTRSTRKSRSSRTHFIHTPTPLAIGWLLISLPLVLWDTGYVLLRPYTMPGGRLIWPIWQPYALYGTVDYIYGAKAWNAGNGFTAAQATLNLVETVAYIYYLVVIGREAEGGWTGILEGLLNAIRFKRAEERGDVRVWGKGVEVATVVLFSACVMTLSKTVLYWLNEAFSSFANIGHNSPLNLLFLWVIPNGAWLVFPSIMIYHLGHELVDGLKGVKEE